MFGPIDYPDSYSSPARFINASRQAFRDPAPWWAEYLVAFDVTCSVLQTEEALDRCDLFMSVGTSSVVYPAAGNLGGAENAERIVETINHLLYDEEGFHGEDDDYYDPRNSYLHEVLDRRRGIPITLSVVLIEVGRRAGVPLAGVGTPAAPAPRCPRCRASAWWGSPARASPRRTGTRGWWSAAPRARRTRARTASGRRP